MTERDQDEKLIEAMARAYQESLGRRWEGAPWGLKDDLREQAGMHLAMQRAYEAHEAGVEFEAEPQEAARGGGFVSFSLKDMDDEGNVRVMGFGEVPTDDGPASEQDQSDIAALREERDRLQTENTELLLALDDWLMAYDLPGDHCELAQVAERTRELLAKTASQPRTGAKPDATVYDTEKDQNKPQ